MTFPEMADLTSTFTSGSTVPTSVTFTWTSAISLFAVFTGDSGGFLSFPLALMATVVPMMTTRRRIETMVILRFRFALMTCNSFRAGGSKGVFVARQE
jgi:hypothetical protein